MSKNEQEPEITVSLYKGKSRKTGRDYECVRVCVGDWVGTVFPRSRFEYDYLNKILGDPDADSDTDES